MPTPSDTTIPAAHSQSLSRTSFTSCPPDERDFFPSREPLSDVGDDVLVARAGVESVAEEREIRHDTPAVDGNEVDSREHSKEVLVEDVHATLDTTSAAPSPEPSPEEFEGTAAQPHTTAAQPAYYMDHLCDRRREPSTTTSFLRPGSRFHGTQRSDRQVYDVQVEIKDVNLAESFLCGYLRIQGLTDDNPTLTTFFEGEIIGPKYLFKTTHPSWGSTEKVDLQHWARFPAWRPLAKSAKSPNFTLNNFQQREHLFMRWKEYFLVPDHRVKTITGASFEGFYYICFNQCDGRVSGIYFHAKSEKYQNLELQHIEDHGCMGAVEFR